MIEGNTVKIVLNRNLRGVVGVGGQLAVGAEWLPGLGAGKDKVLAVRAPDGAGLHKMWIVGAGQRLKLLGLAVIPGQDAARRIEDLQEAIVLEVGHVVERRAFASRRPDGGDHIAAIGRDLGHEADADRAARLRGE